MAIMAGAGRIQKYDFKMREDRENHRVKDESRIGGYGPFKPESRQLILKELFKLKKLCMRSTSNELFDLRNYWLFKRYG